MTKGEYVTEKGSTVKVGDGVFIIAFDWVEEDDACIDCEPWLDHHEGVLRWHCPYHESGSAILKPRSP
ncbi:MAG: hypothetical protein ACREQE_05985 [Candidatus Binataceae bacterium]